jgi:hypothetical protein
MSNLIDDTDSSTGTAVPEPNKPNNKKSRKGVGGTHTHSPFCLCRPCASRRRTPKALSLPTRAGGEVVDSFDDPIKPIVDKNGRRRAAARPLRERIAQYVRVSSAYPNASKTDIAQKMGIARKQLYTIIKEGMEAGILTFDDPIEKIEHEIIPKVVDNLNYYLDQKDKTVTIETAKGTIFKQFQEAKGISDSQQTVLALKIEQPDSGDVKIAIGHIVGRPKTLTEELSNEPCE